MIERRTFLKGIGVTAALSSNPSKLLALGTEEALCLDRFKALEGGWLQVRGTPHRLQVVAVRSESCDPTLEQFSVKLRPSHDSPGSGLHILQADGTPPFRAFLGDAEDHDLIAVFSHRRTPVEFSGR